MPRRSPEPSNHEPPVTRRRMERSLAEASPTDVVSWCNNMDINSLARLREIGRQLGISVQNRNKSRLCAEISNLLEIANVSVRTIIDDAERETKVSSMIDVITADLLVEPVRGQDGRWYNRNHYRRMITNAGRGHVISPYNRQILSKELPEIDTVKQNEVMAFIREHGLEAPDTAELEEPSAHDAQRFREIDIWSQRAGRNVPGRLGVVVPVSDEDSDGDDWYQPERSAVHTAETSRAGWTMNHHETRTAVLSNSMDDHPFACVWPSMYTIPMERDLSEHLGWVLRGMNVKFSSEPVRDNYWFCREGNDDDFMPVKYYIRRWGGEDGNVLLSYRLRLERQALGATWLAQGPLEGVCPFFCAQTFERLVRTISDPAVRNHVHTNADVTHGIPLASEVLTLREPLNRWARMYSEPYETI